MEEVFDMRRLLALMTGVVLATVPLTPALAAPATAIGTHGSLVVMTGDAVVPEGAIVDAVVAFDGRVVIDGQVRQTVVAFRGPVAVSGEVDGDVIVFRGLLTVGPGAEIHGNVFAQRRAIDPAAQIDGTVSGVGRVAWTGEWSSVLVGLAFWLAVAISVLALGFVLLGIAPRAADATFTAAKVSLGPTIGWGFLAFFGLPFVGVLAIATLVGIPFGLGLLFAFALILGVGQTAGAWLLGRTLSKGPSRAVAFLLGWAILTAFSLIPGVGQVLWFAATVIGLGALTVAIWHARRGTVELPAPAVPAAPVPMG